MAETKKIEEKFSYSDLNDLLYDMEWAGAQHPFRGKDIDPKLLGESADDEDLSEFFDITLDAHDFGGTGNKVSVLGGSNPFSEALEDEPGYKELRNYIHNRRAKKGIKAESVNSNKENKVLKECDDMSDEEFVEAFGQELVKNDIKPKKACKGKDCKVLEDLNGYDYEDFGIDTVKEGWSELYDEDGMDNYDFSDIDVDETETVPIDDDKWDWDWDALAQDEEEKEWGKEALESDNLDHNINV